MNVGRNEPCPCGSGLKYKNCHLRAEGEAAPTDRMWQRLHELSQRLPTDLLRFAKGTYGLALLDEAWLEFTLFEEDTFDQDSIEVPVFIPWFFYEWLPDPAKTLVPADQLENFPVASAYLRRRGSYQDPLATQYVRACLSSALSFLEVLTVSPGNGFTMRDCLTGVETSVVERTASQTVRRGDIVFAKIVSLEALSILDGCASIAFPPLEKAAIIELRKHIGKSNTTVTADVLKDFRLEMLEVYHSISDRLLNPKPPVMENTDGDLMMFCRVTYDITSPRAAFDALHHLALDHSEGDLLSDATFDHRGDLLAVEIPWLRKSKPKSGLTKIGLGQIRISGTRLVAEVNSEERAGKFRQIADQRLPIGSRHVSTVIESVNAALEAHRRDHPADVTEDDGEDLNQTPEVRALLADHLRAHYRTWPKIKLPALKGKTPLQAMKTAEGREMVEALLLDFEQRAQSGPDFLPEILNELRATLGLDATL